VDLSQKSVENIDHMVNFIKEKLRVANVGAIKSSHFDENFYDELKDIYEMVKKKQQFSISEIQALAEELGNLRKK
jgi:uncharacterized protein YfkK (UPF0435 family)